MDSVEKQAEEQQRMSVHSNFATKRRPVSTFSGGGSMMRKRPFGNIVIMCIFIDSGKELRKDVEKNKKNKKIKRHEKTQQKKVPRIE